MHRTVLQYLDDILESINNIEEDTAGISFDEFVADRRRKDAVILRRPAGVPVTITDTF
jgi:uncharacterized protein with HEPN domain